ncbi:DUF3631 domain-containing protein [Pseudomonas luteola]
MFSVHLLEDLIQDDEAPWATWNGGKPMSPRQLSAKIGEFGIKSKDVRIGAANKKDYDRTDFVEAWERYLSKEPPFYPGQRDKPIAKRLTAIFHPRQRLRVSRMKKLCNPMTTRVVTLSRIKHLSCRMKKTGRNLNGRYRRRRRWRSNECAWLCQITVWSCKHSS